MSSAAETGDTAHRSARAELGGLRLRVLSGLALAPFPVAAVWFGWPWLPLLTGLAALVMAWEWSRLCGRGNFGATGMAAAAALVAAVASAAFAQSALAVAVVLCGAAIAFWAARRAHHPAPAWAAFGVLWLGLPCVCFLWLARASPAGRTTLLWIFVVVWATDIGAYASGRSLKGPLLGPRWSPAKTWAGLFGGAAFAALAGWATAAWLGIDPALPLVLLSAALAIVEQFGDLAESVVKRRFGVKDASGLIPGHGGLLDRLDGLLAVAPAVVLLTLGGGNVLSWR